MRLALMLFRGAMLLTGVVRVYAVGRTRLSVFLLPRRCMHHNGH